MWFRHISIYMDKKGSLVCGQWWARTFWSTCCNRTRPLWVQFTPERLWKERSLQKPLKPLLQVFSRRLLLRRLRARRFPQDLTLPLYPSLAHSLNHTLSVSLSVSSSLSFGRFLCAFVALFEIRSEGRQAGEKVWWRGWGCWQPGCWKITRDVTVHTLFHMYVPSYLYLFLRFFFLPGGWVGEGLCGRRCFRRGVVNVLVSSFRSRRWSFLYFVQESTRGYVYERP